VSKASVLIIATRYDVGSHYTYLWAKDLHEKLVLAGHVCLMLDGSSFCRNGNSLEDAIQCAEVVAFYGHGLQDRWIGLPNPANATGTSMPIIDGNNLSVLDGRKVYAQCCDSLSHLGPAYNALGKPLGFVGYDARFGFHTSNHEHFRDIANNGAMALVTGASAQDVKTQLFRDWEDLRDQFGSGSLQWRSDAFAASKFADENSRCVGATP
jgi:hypothetical protein